MIVCGLDDGSRLRRVVQEGEIAPGVGTPFRDFKVPGLMAKVELCFTGRRKRTMPRIAYQRGVFRGAEWSVMDRVAQAEFRARPAGGDSDQSIHQPGLIQSATSDIGVDLIGA